MRTVICNLRGGGGENLGTLPRGQNMKCASPLPLSIPPPKTAFWSHPRQRGWGTCKNITKSNIPDPVKDVFSTNHVMRIPPPTFYTPSQNVISGTLAQRSRIFPKCASPLPILSPPRIVLLLQYPAPGGCAALRQGTLETHRGHLNPASPPPTAYPAPGVPGGTSAGDT